MTAKLKVLVRCPPSASALPLTGLRDVPPPAKCRLPGLENGPEKAGPDLMRAGYRFSEKIMFQQEIGARWRFEEKSSRFMLYAGAPSASSFQATSIRWTRYLVIVVFCSSRKLSSQTPGSGR